MTLDAYTLGALVDELGSTILGGRVQHVHLPDELGLALEVYAQGRSWWLYASAHPQRGRLHLVEARPPRTSDAVTPLLLLLRKYVDGGRVDEVYQPPLERIVRLRFSSRGPAGEPWRTELVVELLGRQANLILLAEDGVVMDAARRLTSQQSRTRLILPQHRYAPPPAPDKLDPRHLVPSALAAAAQPFEPRRPLREVLVATVGACSPLLAREVVFRACGEIDAPLGAAPWERVTEVFGALWADAGAGRWAPSAAYQGERMLAFAAYPLRSFEDVRPVASISRAVEVWYRQDAPAVDPQAARKAPLAQALDAARDRLRAKRYSLQQGLIDPAEVARLRQAGEYLLAFGAQLAPDQTSFVLPDDDVPLPLDPSRTPVENAQRYFARYQKAKTAAREVPAMLEATERELAYLDEASIHLELAATPDELAALQAEWAELGYVRRPGAHPRPGGKGQGSTKGTGGGKGARGAKGARGKAGDRAGPGYRRVIVDGFEVLVGRSGKGNDALLSREGHPADVWLHARGVPGAHVIVRSAGRAVPEGVLRRAASLAAAQSAARTAGSVAVDYTLRKYVDRIKGAPPGLVTYRGERTIHVPPGDEDGPR
ncbi:MAG TPA: NFACT RNA binding domain-containing protein [Chloroflexota bacterium]|nr:NFACT RNA binding domain-containing protein [Chloroflexota bacterium]